VHVMGYYREPLAPQGAASLAGPAPVTMPRYFHGVVSRFSAGRRSLSLGDRQAVTSFLQRSGISFQGIQQFLGGEGVANVGDRHKLAAKVGELLAPMRGGQIHGNAFRSDELDEKLIEQAKALLKARSKEGFEGFEGVEVGATRASFTVRRIRQIQTESVPISRLLSGEVGRPVDWVGA
jgi:hypothetical protein